MSKKVTVKQMTLVNFKGIKSLTVDFGQVTEISGANATGKSTIADAFNWVLFGKDTAGNSDSKFGIKTVDASGKIIEKIDHEVTAILEVKGESIELRRVLSENWVTARGKAEPELKGNSTAYFYNGVPLKESEYKAKIGAIIDEDLFRMLTNPLHFPRLDWQVQREMLLRIAGGITLEEIAKDREEFSVLLSQLSGKSLQEYKTEISARKKKIKEALDLIPARIDEVRRATPESPDYAMLNRQRLEFEGGIAGIDKAIQSAAEATRQEYEAQNKLQSEINTQKGIQQEVLFKAQQKAVKTAYEKNAVRNDAEAKRDALQKELGNLTASAKKDIELLQSDYQKNILQTGEYNRKVQTLRNQWEAENEKEYSDSDNCPTCGQLLPEDKRKGKRILFDEAKAKELKRITDEGIELNNKIHAFEKDNERIKEDLGEERAKVEKCQSEISVEIQTMEKVLNDNPPVPVDTEVKGENLPDWNAAESRIKELSEALNNRRAAINSNGNSDLTAKKRELQAQLDDIKKQLALKDVIEANEKRKSELLKEEKELAQQKADLEKQEFTADALVKKQMNEVERRVNMKFSLVKFKMFSQQLNGGEKPDCILVSAETGAKFMDTNNADKINIGLDIINTLCEFNGVCAPIFVDNAEGINQLLPVNSQLVKLIVTHDKELNISI
jgi:chromosome segregation ATPase